MSTRSRDESLPSLRLGPPRYVAMTPEQEELVVTALTGMLLDAEAKRARSADSREETSGTEPGPCP